MRILEQTESILTLQNSAKYFLRENIILVLFGYPLVIIFPLFIVSYGIWWGFVCLVIGGFLFCTAVQETWTNNLIKDCSFNKNLGTVTIKFHGLKTKIKYFQL
jgi:hypothetical protein